MSQVVFVFYFFSSLSKIAKTKHRVLFSSDWRTFLHRFKVQGEGWDSSQMSFRQQELTGAGALPPLDASPPSSLPHPRVSKSARETKIKLKTLV